jgi:GT2 family glycosyltransferase
MNASITSLLDRTTAAVAPGAPRTSRVADNARLPMTVSVLIVSWNARDYLRSCLQSIRRARPSCLHEIIVVDNASTDGSPEMVTRCFPEAKLVRAGANLGFARANNLAMSLATGSAFALVNSDALVHPGCLESLVEHLESNPAVGMVGPRVLGGDGQLQRTCQHLPGFRNTLCRALALDRFNGSVFSSYEGSTAQHDRLHRPDALSGCFCVARRSAVDRVGMLDERFFFYAEDIDWCKRFYDAGWTLAFVPHATATHFGGGSSSQAHVRFSIEFLRATLMYWRKHYGPVGEWSCRQLLVLHHGVRWAARSCQRMAGRGRSEGSRHKWAEHSACLKWLLFGTELSGAAAGGRARRDAPEPSGETKGR